MSKFFSKNEGSVDRSVRIAGGLALVVLAITGLTTPWAYLGAIPLLTGIVGVCPLYSIVGLTTCKLGGCTEDDMPKPMHPA